MFSTNTFENSSTHNGSGCISPSMETRIGFVHGMLYCHRGVHVHSHWFRIHTNRGRPYIAFSHVANVVLNNQHRISTSATNKKDMPSWWISLHGTILVGSDFFSFNIRLTRCTIDNHVFLPRDQSINEVFQERRSRFRFRDLPKTQIPHHSLSDNRCFGFSSLSCLPRT